MTLDKKILELENKLEEHEKRICTLEELCSRAKTKSIREGYGDSEQRLREFSEEIGIDVEQLKYVFHFGEEDLTLIAVIKGKKENERQLKATLCILTGYHYYYGEDEIRSQELRKKLRWSGIRSLTNLNSNLKRHRELLIPKGKPGSPEFRYQIIYPGIKKGIEIIKELCEDSR